MGINNEKGRAYEMHIAKLIRRKGGDKGAMRNAGSHANWNRRSDVFTNLPIHIEAKHHENVRIKEWVEQAEAAKSFNQTAVVAFRIDEKDYAVLDFNELLDLFVQIADLQLEVEDLRAPIDAEALANLARMTPADVQESAKRTKLAQDIEPALKTIVEAKKKQGGTKYCRAGHIADDYGYCLQKGCKYTRNYKPPKAKKG